MVHLLLPARGPRFSQRGKSSKFAFGSSRNSIRDLTTPNPSAGARAAQASLRFDVRIRGCGRPQLCHSRRPNTVVADMQLAASPRRLRLCLRPWPSVLRAARCVPRAGDSYIHTLVTPYRRCPRECSPSARLSDATRRRILAAILGLRSASH